MSRDRWIRLGNIGRPHGLDGKIWFVPFNANSNTLKPNLDIKIELSGRSVDSKIFSIDKRGARYLLSINGIQDRSAASGLTGGALYIKRSDFNEIEPGEFYHADLPGLEVRGPDSNAIGRVKDVFTTPAHDVLAIDLDQGNETLVPVVSDWVSAIKPDLGYILLARSPEEPR
ncbi:MAG: 16S rRNA processing protein RimM [Deltaproteobacteria bacterium]|nr:16S rRNA processing protein RimM [Deltaproteobacteria bacterium]